MEECPLKGSSARVAKDERVRDCAPRILKYQQPGADSRMLILG